jgi:hypothetical protein
VAVVAVLVTMLTTIVLEDLVGLVVGEEVLHHHFPQTGLLEQEHQVKEITEVLGQTYMVVEAEEHLLQEHLVQQIQLLEHQEEMEQHLLFLDHQ